MITYSLKDSGILSVKFSGSVSAGDIKKYLSEIERNTKLSKNLFSLYDLREAKLEIDVEDVKSISKLANSISASFEIVRTAFIVNKPDVTAFSILFKDLASKDVEREVFSTEEAAKIWLEKK